MTGRTLPRRRFLRGLGGGVAFGAGLMSASCTSGLPAAPPRRPAPDLSRTQHVVRFANWPDYVDSAPGHPGHHPTLAEFTRGTGIRVDYSEPIQGNEQFLGRIGAQLALGADCGYDLVVLSDWLVSELAGRGWAQAVSSADVPDAARLAPEFRSVPLPHVNGYSLPWQGGFTGIAWNESATHRPVTSMADLLTSRDLRGRVSIVTDMRDDVGLVLLDQGHDPSSFSEAQFGQALARLRRAVSSGQIRAVTNDYMPALAKGDIAACVAWSGDVIEQSGAQPQLRFALPGAGGMVWTDNMMIPAFTPHRRNAERLMNFYYHPAVAAQLAAYEQFVCPVVGAQAVMRHLDPSVATQKFVFPDAGTLARSHYFRPLSRAENASYANRFSAAVGL